MDSFGMDPPYPGAMPITATAIFKAEMPIAAIPIAAIAVAL
jgi:hypothetical protein